jgi:Domain of unknown function (DUF4271)
MKQFYSLLFFICFSAGFVAAQTDSTAAIRDSLQKDSLRRQTLSLSADSLQNMIPGLLSADSLKVKDSLRTLDSIRQVQKVGDSLQKLQQKQPVQNLKDGENRIFYGKEYLFYFLVFLLLLFGVIRRAFSKYFYDLFRVFFKTTLKQKQTQELLLQSPLPSVVMNSFFVLSAGLYVNFLLQYFQLSVTENFWLQYVYCAAALTAIYFLKYTGLKITGWLFNVSSAADSYIFIVFIINKMMGIFLLPFLLLLAFSTPQLSGIVMIVSWIGIGMLLLYRFVLSYGAVRKEVKLNSFHFILYILAFEIVPLLLIYKLLLLIF